MESHETLAVDACHRIGRRGRIGSSWAARYGRDARLPPYSPSASAWKERTSRDSLLVASPATGRGDVKRAGDNRIADESCRHHL